MNANQRTSLYVFSGSVITAISIWGLLTSEQAAAILAVCNGLLGVVMAFTAVKHITPDEPVPPITFGDDDGMGS